MSDIYVFGSINMDLVFDIDRMPKQGETIHGNTFFMSPGGKGANQAVACSKQGLKTYMIGSVGDDKLSQQLIQTLQSFKVDTTFVSVQKNTTCGCAGILLEDGDNRIILHSGANDIHSPVVIQNIVNQHIQKDDVLIAQLEVPLDVVELAFTNAKEKGIITVLNAAPAKDLPHTLYQTIDYLIVNEIEFETLTSCQPSSMELIEKGCQSLLQKGITHILLTLGKEGSIYISNETTIIVPAYQVTAVDTTSAGDTYIGAFLAAYIENNEIETSMKYASIASAMTVTKKGAQQSIPTSEEVHAFMKKENIK